MVPDPSSAGAPRRLASFWVRRAAATGAGVFLAVIFAAWLTPPASQDRPPDCGGAKSIDSGCFVERYTILTRTSGPGAALAELGAGMQSNVYLLTTCHQLTHVIGRTAGQAAGKSAFSLGNDLCASGYFHGVTEAVMLAMGRDHVVDGALKVCSEERQGQPKSYLHYNCVHGMGHGFMAVYDDDLFQSLAGCDGLADQWEQRHCYGGVFMENLTAFSKAPDVAANLRASEPLYPMHRGCQSLQG